MNAIRNTAVIVGGLGLYGAVGYGAGAIATNIADDEGRITERGVAIGTFVVGGTVASAGVHAVATAFSNRRFMGGMISAAIGAGLIAGAQHARS